MRQFIIVICVVVLFVITSTKGSADDNVIEVNTANGPVRGHLGRTLFENREYFAFKGIPYAEPPVERLRFKVTFLINVCIN